MVFNENIKNKRYIILNSKEYSDTMGLFDKVHEMDIDRKINKKVNKFFENEDYLNRLKMDGGI